MQGNARPIETVPYSHKINERSKAEWDRPSQSPSANKRTQRSVVRQNLKNNYYRTQWSGVRQTLPKPKRSSYIVEGLRFRFIPGVSWQQGRAETYPLGGYDIFYMKPGFFLVVSLCISLSLSLSTTFPCGIVPSRFHVEFSRHVSTWNCWQTESGIFEGQKIVWSLYCQRTHFLMDRLLN